MSEFKLCYVKLPWVYFTTQDLDKQWGDDWNDSSYEHNAGEPYLPGKRYFSDGREEKIEDDWNEDGTPKWEVKKVAVYGEIYEPSDVLLNSPYSVEAINKGACAWLSVNPYRDDTVYLQAGTTYEDFLSVCKKADIEVYEKRY